MIHGLSSCWTFLSRTVKELSSFLAPLEKAIRLHLLPKLCLHPPNDSEWAMLALPIHSGGLGIFNPCQSSEDSYKFSVSVTSPMAAAIINQLSSFDCTIFHRQRDLEQEALSIKHQRFADSLSTLSSTLPPNLQLSLKLAGEKGASSWLSTLPLECYGFSFIRVNFVMLLLSILVGLLRIFLPTVFVVNLTPLNMLSVALMELSQPCNTMTYEI